MKSIHKIFCGVLSLCAFMVANSVLAQESTATEQSVTTKSRAVLFKIHDIEPIQNSDGLVNACDFLVTFYNRTPDSLRYGKLDLGWIDDVSDRFVVEGDESSNDQVAQRPQTFSARDKSKLGDVKTSVDMPALGAYAQISVKGNVKTEKCYLLLNPAQFKVTSCAIADSDNPTEKKSARSSSRLSGECAGLFQFVDPSNPEYYDEFKDVSFSEQEALLNKEKQTNLDDINVKYNNIVNTIEQANTTLRNIQ